MTGTSATFSGFVGVNGSPATAFPLEAYINSATAYTTSSRGNVLRVYNTNTGANIFAGIELGGAGSANDGLAGINATVTGNGSAALTFYTRDANTFSEKFRIASTGAATFSSSVTATSGQITGILQVGSGTVYSGMPAVAQFVAGSRTTSDGGIVIQSTSTSISRLLLLNAADEGSIVRQDHNTGYFEIFNGGSRRFYMTSTGAATFSSSVTLSATSGYNLISNSDILLANAKPLRAYTTGGSAWRLISLESDNNVYIAGNGGNVIMNGGGNVGIGTASPNRTTEIVSSGGAVLGVSTSSSGASILYGRIAMYSTFGSNGYIDYGGEIRSYSGAGIDYSDLRFYTAAGATSAERMRITSGGMSE